MLHIQERHGAARHYRGRRMSVPFLGRDQSGQAGVVAQRIADA
jgi:hypothetical protein